MLAIFLNSIMDEFCDITQLLLFSSGLPNSHLFASPVIQFGMILANSEHSVLSY